VAYRVLGDLDKTLEPRSHGLEVQERLLGNLNYFTPVSSCYVATAGQIFGNCDHEATLEYERLLAKDPVL
jgi:hypothetical protein